jgi:uncharacterized membrane protein
LFTASHDAERADFRFHIQPNCSLSPAPSLLVYGTVGLVALSVALRFMVLGAWMVLPFTLLELGLLIGVLVQIWRKQQEDERITIANGEVRIVQKSIRETRESRFPHYWVAVVVKHSRARNHPARLLLRSHGKEIEIGRHLTEEERLDLAEALKHAIGAQHQRNRPDTKPVSGTDDPTDAGRPEHPE